MRIFITGGTGFIGAWVVKEILATQPDATLVILARNPDKIPSFRENPRIRIVDGELKDFDVIEAAMSKCDACMHIALGWGETPVTMLDNDTRATVHLLQAAAKHRMRRFIYTSSTAAGGHDREWLSEETAPLPVDLYGATKLASEAYVRGVSSQLGLSAHIIRPGYTFGNPAFPGATPQVDRRFHDIVTAALTDAPIRLVKHDGTQFIAADVLAKLYTGCLALDEPCQTFYGLGNRFVTWETIAKIAIEKLRSKSPITLEERGRFAAKENFDVGKIQKYFGVSSDPQTALEAHLDWLIDSLRRDSEAG